MMSEKEYPDDEPEQADDGSPVFIPRDAVPGDFPKSVWEPGIVEVILKQSISPESLIEAVNPPPNVQPPDLALFAGLANVLRNYGLKDAVFSFESLEKVEPVADNVSPPEGTVEYGRENYITLFFPHDKDVVQIAKDLNQLELVERAVPVPEAIPPATPTDEPFLGEHTDIAVPNPASGFENQWYVFRCCANRAWDSGASGTGVVIADIDSGFLISHQDIETRIELTYNSYDKSKNVCQGKAISHGTAVLGFAGAADNDLGIIGFAFGASLWAIQANIGTGPKPRCNTWARAIDYVRKADSGDRRKVIILEVQTKAFGNYEMVLSVNKAIKDAIAAGIVVCVTAGNGNRDVSIDDMCNPIPATGSILVGATQHDPPKNTRIWFSNHGDRVVVSAPGDDRFDITCNSESVNSYRGSFGGTSGAAPKVAGAIALMLEKNPGLSHNDIKNILMTTGAKVITEPDRPVGRFLDVEAAVEEAIRRAPKPLINGPVYKRQLSRL